MRPEPAIESLRAQIEKIEGRSRRVKSVLPFGIAEVDSRLPGEGLALGALHEIAGGGNGAIDGAAAALFAAGIAARTKGKVLWCLTRPDLFAPALAQAGLPPDRVIYVEAGDDKTVLACVEEGLRHGGLGAVVAEIGRLSMTASRRLQLAAEGARDGRWLEAAGIVLVRQRPGSAKGVMFITLEDETSIANLVVWPQVFEKNRRIILSAGMFAVRGRVQREGEVVHLVAQRLTDLSAELASVGDRDAALPLPHGRGDEFHHGSPTPDPRGLAPKGLRTRDIYIPDLHIDSIKVKTRDFR